MKTIFKVAVFVGAMSSFTACGPLTAEEEAAIASSTAANVVDRTNPDTADLTAGPRREDPRRLKVPGAQTAFMPDAGQAEDPMSPVERVDVVRLQSPSIGRR